MNDGATAAGGALRQRPSVEIAQRAYLADCRFRRARTRQPPYQAATAARERLPGGQIARPWDQRAGPANAPPRPFFTTIPAFAPKQTPTRETTTCSGRLRS